MNLINKEQDLFNNLTNAVNSTREKINKDEKVKLDDVLQENNYVLPKYPEPEEDIER